MHEWSLMLALREQVLERAAAAGACRVDRIVVRIGSLAGVEADALRAAHRPAMAGSIAAASLLELELVMAQAYCMPCQRPFAAHDGWCECPDCGAISATLLCGRELDLVAIDLTVHVPSPSPGLGSPAAFAPAAAEAQPGAGPRQPSPFPGRGGSGPSSALGAGIRQDRPA